MPKKPKPSSKGKFLESKLSDAKYDLVRREFPPWYEVIKKEDGGDTCMSPALLADFADHLGYHDKDFQSLPDSKLSTTYKGARQIYEYLRKRMGKPDERSTPRRALRSKGKAPASKPNKPTTPTKKAAENSEAVVVTATGTVGL